jgi:hypothetical protein
MNPAQNYQTRTVYPATPEDARAIGVAFRDEITTARPFLVLLVIERGYDGKGNPITSPGYVVTPADDVHAPWPYVWNAERFSDTPGKARRGEES